MTQRPEIINGRDVLRADRDRSPRRRRRRHAANAEDAADIAAEDNAIADAIAVVADDLSREARADARAEAIAANIAEQDAMSEDDISVSFTMDVGEAVPPTVRQAVAEARGSTVWRPKPREGNEVPDRQSLANFSCRRLLQTLMKRIKTAPTAFETTPFEGMVAKEDVFEGEHRCL